MLADGVTLYHAVLSHCVNLHLLGALQELGNNHRMLLAYHSGVVQGGLQLRTVANHTHGGTRQHV